MDLIGGKLVLPTGPVDGVLEIDAGRIARIAPGETAPGNNDYRACLVLPGFIDVHMHGLGRHDVFEATDLVEISRIQPRFGTTGFLPTAASLSRDRYGAFGRHVRAAQQAADNRGAKILGAHFEGPFVNPAAKGGMDEAFLRPVELDECRWYLDQSDGAMRLMTVAPELPGALELIRLLRRHGVVVSIGHSRASGEELARAVDAGLSLVCHLFNAFERTGNDPSWPWRRGLLDAVLGDGRLAAEVNGDMIHIRPEHLRLAIERFGPDRFVAITDSVPGAALEPGEYTMTDGRRLSTASGAARLVSNGTLVGSVMTMNQIFANLVRHCGVGLTDAARFTSTNAARALGLADKMGSLEVGKAADLAVLDADYRCVATLVDGRKVYEA
jgi:N-acetylglucosamine-6-phosphate deacetylase